MVLISAVSEATGATSAVVATHARTARAELTHISEYFSFSLRSGSDTAIYLYPSNTSLEINIVFHNNNHVSGPPTHKRHLLFFYPEGFQSMHHVWYICTLKISCPQWHHVVVIDEWYPIQSEFLEWFHIPVLGKICFGGHSVQWQCQGIVFTEFLSMIHLP